LKFAAVVSFAGGMAILWISPPLFHSAFGMRYEEGLAVMPWTMAACLWYGLLLVAQNYLWCAERAKLSTIPLTIGLAANIALNVVLIPTWGLLGTVVSTALATGLALAVLYVINRRNGMQIQPGLIWLSLLPIAMCGGVLWGSIALVALAAALPFSRTLLTEQDRGVVAEFYRGLLDRMAAYRSPRIEPVEASHVL
jgi:O-antigen/teichoic acid export membrane protein